jgi:pyruvate kinase
VGAEVLIDDGLISMTVVSKSATSVTCRVANNGILGQVPAPLALE